MKKIITNTLNQEDDNQEHLHHQDMPNPERFLDIQEHIDDYSDEELEELFKDSNLAKDLESAAMLKQSLSPSDDIDISAEWQDFAKKHYSPTHQWRKIAATSIGVIVTSGIILAAVSLRHPGREQTSALVADSVKTQVEQGKAIHSTLSSEQDTISTKGAESIEVFDNVELAGILAAMSQYYGKDVEYQTAAVRHLHFHYEWNKKLSLLQNIMVLNSFEHVNIKLEQDKIVVE